MKISENCFDFLILLFAFSAMCIILVIQLWSFHTGLDIWSLFIPMAMFITLRVVHGIDCWCKGVVDVHL